MRKTILQVAAVITFGMAPMCGGAGVAMAAPEEADEPTQGEQLFAQFPLPPAKCYLYWDPIEDAIEAFVEGPPEVPVPQWADDWFDAFDDWCEGDND